MHFLEIADVLFLRRRCRRRVWKPTRSCTTPHSTRAGGRESPRWRLNSSGRCRSPVSERTKNIPRVLLFMAGVHAVRSRDFRQKRLRKKKLVFLPLQIQVVGPSLIPSCWSPKTCIYNTMILSNVSGERVGGGGVYSCHTWPCVVVRP